MSMYFSPPDYNKDTHRETFISLVSDQLSFKYRVQFAPNLGTYDGTYERRFLGSANMFLWDICHANDKKQD